VLLSSGDSFPHLIQKRRSQLGFVTYLLNYLRIYIFSPHDNVYVNCLTLLREILYINNLEADVIHISLSVPFISQDEPISVEHSVKVCTTESTLYSGLKRE